MDWRPTQDRPAARAARLAAAALAAILVLVVAMTLLVPFAAHGFVRAIELTTNAFVSVAMSASVGVSVWSTLGTVGRHAADLLGTKQASLVVTLLMAIAGLAAYALQRLIGSD